MNFFLINKKRVVYKIVFEVFLNKTIRNTSVLVFLKCIKYSTTPASPQSYLPNQRLGIRGLIP